MPGLDGRVHEGLAVQLDRWRAELGAGARRVGWKLGRGIEEVEAIMGTRPVIGHLTDATRIAAGAQYRGARAGALRAETELALELARSVDPGADPVTAWAAIDGLRVALELVDVGPPRGDVRAVLAANVFHRAFALGPRQPVTATADRRAVLCVGGQERGSATLAADYADAVLDAAVLLAMFGERLEAGDVLLTGSVIHMPVAPGDQVRVAIDGLGDVTVDIAD